jgi:dipeptidyl aminopeptidase/acylaminoacyl peptidase
VTRTAAIVFALVAVVPVGAAGESRYKMPPKAIVDAIDASAPPEAVPSPARDSLLLVEYEANPPIAVIARPMLRIGGIRIDPAMGSRRRTRRATRLIVQPLDGPARPVSLPSGARIGAPIWSPDGKRFAFARDLSDGVELWVGESASGTAHAIPAIRLNDVLAPQSGGAGPRPFAWLRDSRRLLVWTVPGGREPAPAPDSVPSGPVVEETAGKKSQMATFEDLLKDPHDEDLFEHYATSQIAVVDPDAGGGVGTLLRVGPPGMYTAVEASPDGQWLLTARVHRPFSTRVPFSLFARTTEVWDAAGRKAATVCDLPVSDEVPRQGVPLGPRAIEWQPLAPATLVWVEALDGGDPTRKVPNRDRLISLSAPFSGSGQAIHHVQHRFIRIVWSGRSDVALVVEHDRDRRWETTRLVNVSDSASPGSVLFDRSVNDAYGDPGAPVMHETPSGHRVILQDGDAIFLAGAGASESGDHPFLDRVDLVTGKKERVFRSDEAVHEAFVTFSPRPPGGRPRIVTRRESPAEPPNYFLLDTRTGRRRSLTTFADPAPQVAHLRKELVRYARKDGVALSGTLYLPPDWKPGVRVPVLIWAYPLEYSDGATAGQVRGSTKTYTHTAGPSPVLLALEGYAVLNDATMPIVGDPETVNNTYLEQIADAARAAIDKLDEMGVADRRRVAIGGHSYGAFMTANLMAHTDLFAAGIARSGAYNRSLTPFGFQTERRSYWEATDLYTKISPFTFAPRIRRPILLIHGEADDNSGTFPIQSERLYQAIKGNGGTARLVLLPDEAHAYRARESVLHVLAEMLEWADRWVKNASDGGGEAVRTDR